MSASFHSVSGLKLTIALIGNSAYVAGILHARMVRVEYILSDAVEKKNLHISTEIHRFYASIVQVVHVLQAPNLIK